MARDDLRRLGKAIRVFENNLSGRKGRDSATKLGLRRISDSDHPNVIQNYRNFSRTADRSRAPRWIKNAPQGRYVADRYLNLASTRAIRAF